MRSKAITRAMVTALAIWTLMPLPAGAASITLGGPLPGAREATLAEAISGVAGTGNATVADVDNYFGGTWKEVGECTGGDPCVAGGLTVDLLTGSWGGGAASGTWSMTAPFSYTDLAFSIHVGNGNGDPDHFVWLVANAGVPAGPPYSGVWEYSRGSTRGGGLSNFKAYGRNSDVTLPDGGVTIGLLGFAMLGLGYLRKRIG